MLVTGGAGFIGANYVRQTVADRPDIAITVVDSLGYAANLASLAPVRDQIGFIQGSIADADLTARLVKDADIVVNFAAESHNDNSLTDPRPFLESNVIGTWNLLEAARRYGTRLHHVSTDEVFGDLELDDPSRFTAESPYRPSSPYSATKASADLLVRAWVRSFGVRATISNCANNYGPLQHVEKFIPRQITNILLGSKPKVYGTGANVRDWTHVGDHNAAVQAIIESGRSGETYLIGAGCEADNLTVVRTLLRIMGKPEDWLDFVSDRPGHDTRYAVNPAKLMTELGWRPRYRDLEAGLEATVAWYADHRDWWEAAKRETEARYALIGR
jgi:dTDP-glucose 4,6-dehydratase